MKTTLTVVVAVYLLVSAVASWATPAAVLPKGYLAGNRFAEGSRIVVDYFNIKGNPAVDGPRNMIVLMRKDKRFKQTGGWQFAGFGADGKPSGLDPVKTCFDCHVKDAAQKDFVISTKKDFM